MYRPNQATITDELFEQFIKEDKWIHEIRNACKCCYSDGSFRYYRTVTYPTEYIVSEHQIEIAAKLYDKRHDEVLANIKKGELVFRAMGGSYSPRFEDDVCNHRMRCYFKSSCGRTWFAELCRTSEEREEKGIGFYYDFAFGVIDGKSCYDISPSFPIIEQGGHRFYNRDIYRPFTWKNVLEEINSRFGCNYTSARLENYFVGYKEWVCEC